MRFLGACNTYWRFIKGYEKTSRALSNILRKDCDPDWESPTDEKQHAFETLKVKHVSKSSLALPKANHPTMIDTDERRYAVGAVLLHQQEDDNPKQWATYGYWSKMLRKKERKDYTIQEERYAVVWAIFALRPYI